MTKPARDWWYRRTTWSAEDEQDFLVRLKRARQKAQYLVLQASALVDTGDAVLVGAGLRLVDRMLAEYPDPFFLSNAFLTRAEALVRLNRPEEAVFAFRGALEARRAMPNLVNYAYLEFAWTVARLDMQSFFDEALAVLREFQQAGDLAFPTNAYRYFGALALMQAARGERTEARRRAKEALDAISQPRGPFGRHPTFGVVDAARIEAKTHQRLWALAAV